MLSWLKSIFGKEQRRGVRLSVHEFAVEVTKRENGIGRGTDVAQVKEILSITDELLNNKFYPLVRSELVDLSGEEE